MRVYHFINSKFGIQDIKMRRIKVALLNDLNDPFEFFSTDLSDIHTRYSFTRMKAEFSRSIGLICFSHSCQNPVQWSHYADKHQGLCLGFEIPDEKLGKVDYSIERLVVATEDLLAFSHLDYGALTKFLFTKYSHWHYENEFRQIVNLDEMYLEDDKYFAKFSKDLKLVQVIVGAKSKLTRADLDDALGNLRQDVKVFKARLAFKTFRVVRNKNPQEWA